MTSLSFGQVKKNVIYSIAAQFISLAIGAILNLVVPKFIDEYQYAYWQTYILYVGYVGVLHFGLLDGIVLRYSQYNYYELDKIKIRSQLIVLVLINGIFATMVALYAFSIIKDNIAKEIAYYIAIGIVCKNLFTFVSYLFQITNRIRKYALLTIVYRLVYGTLAIIFLCVGAIDFRWFCIADLCGDMFGIVFGAINNKELFWGSLVSIKDAMEEAKINISAGVKLMLATWSSFLLTGTAKIIIQNHWDELTFGKISFAFSLTSLFLAFITAISIVLFPSIKRMDTDKLPKLYQQIRCVISPLFVVVMLLYYPACWLLGKWLPKYSESLECLGLMLPIILYSSKVNLLTNNYLKAYRKEDLMSKLNISSLLIGIVLYIVSAYVLNSIYSVIICIVIAVALRSMASEIEISRLLHLNITKSLILESLMSIAFIATTTIPKRVVGFLIYLALSVIYLYFIRDSWFIEIKNKCRN